MKNAFGLVVKSALIGIGVLFISMIISFFASSDGVRSNVDAWPVTAKAILKESPGKELTSEQWKRIRKELSDDPNKANASHLFAAEIRSTWFVFVALSVFALLLAHRYWIPLSISTAAAMLAPTTIFLIAAFQHVHPYY